MLDKDAIKRSLTERDIVLIMSSLGSGEPKEDGNGNLIFRTYCHHVRGGKEKLYYYPESGNFFCYSECGSMDIYEIIMRNRDMGLSEAISYVANTTGKGIAKRRVGFIDSKNTHLVDDWDFIDGYEVLETQSTNYKTISKGYLECFDNIYHRSWIEDGISVDTMKENGIRYCIKDHQIIIPHFHGVTGDLIGIRCRNLIDSVVNEEGKKYMPVYLQGMSFAHSLGGNLYGLHRNKKTIKKLRKAMIVEAEKSVLQCETMYGNSNFTVATCSSNITNVQRDMLLDCDIEEVILAPDKDFPIDSNEYREKMIVLARLAKKFAPYVRVYILEDSLGYLDLKDSPTDKGKSVLEKLMRNKVELTMEEIDLVIKGEW